MKPPYEDLSRLRSGDLAEDEAAALRRRIDAEPEVARAWADLGALADALSGLPETPPPPSLDARVLGGPAPAPRLRWRWGAAAAVAAAVLVVALSWRPAADRITLVEGMQLVDGQVELLAGDVPVTIDGMARVSVEPAGPLARGPGEEAPMKVIAGTAGGAVLGAVVTVAVLSGTATVTPANGSPVVLDAGQVRTFRPPGASSAGAVSPSGTDEVAALQAEVATLREKLAEAQFTGAVARGQVVATQGEPVAWPADIPDVYRQAAFEANLRAEVAKVPGLEVHAIDCSEYPCLATMTGIATEPGWEDKLKQIPQSLDAAYPDASVWMGIAKMDDGADVRAAAGIGLTRPSEAQDPAIRTRTDFRAKAMMDEL